MSKLVGRSSSSSGDGKYEKDEDEVTETGGYLLWTMCGMSTCVPAGKEQEQAGV